MPLDMTDDVNADGYGWTRHQWRNDCIAVLALLAVVVGLWVVGIL